jgi:tryptophan 2,3-dioxygenase
VAGYSDYLKLDQLLALQEPRSDSHRTEQTFIVVHQVYELWFKLIIEDLGLAIGALGDDDLPSTLRHLRDVHDVERLLVEQLVLIDHLEPGGFAEIRSALGSASAAESRQFATIEAMSSTRRRAPRPHGTPDLWSMFCAYAQRRGLDMPTDDTEEALQRRTEAIVRIYRVERGLLADLCEALLDHDHAFCTWRHRHSLAAARQIGQRPGTGGSAGVSHLERTMNRRFYPELWAARTSFEATISA